MAIVDIPENGYIKHAMVVAGIQQNIGHIRKFELTITKKFSSIKKKEKCKSHYSKT